MGEALQNSSPCKHNSPNCLVKKAKLTLGDISIIQIGHNMPKFLKTIKMIFTYSFYLQQEWLPGWQWHWNRRAAHLFCYHCSPGSVCHSAQWRLEDLNNLGKLVFSFFHVSPGNWFHSDHQTWQQAILTSHCAGPTGAAYLEALNGYYNKHRTKIRDW